MSATSFTTLGLLRAEGAYRGAAMRELTESLRLGSWRLVRVALRCLRNAEKMRRERQAPGTGRDGQVSDE